MKSNINIEWGALIEKAEIEIEKAVKNIIDPNTDYKKKREITIKIGISSGEDRKSAVVTTSCNSRLASYKPYQSIVFIGEQNGEIFISEQNPDQMNLFKEITEDKVFEISNSNTKPY